MKRECQVAKSLDQGRLGTCFNFREAPSTVIGWGGKRKEKGVALYGHVIEVDGSVFESCQPSPLFAVDGNLVTSRA